MDQRRVELLVQLAHSFAHLGEHLGSQLRRGALALHHFLQGFAADVIHHHYQFVFQLVQSMDLRHMAESAALLLSTEDFRIGRANALPSHQVFANERPLFGAVFGYERNKLRYLRVGLLQRSFNAIMGIVIKQRKERR